MCVPGISLSLVLSLHNTRASLYLHTITTICVVSRSSRCRMKLSRLLLSTLHQCQQSTLWLGLILMLDCCLVQCTVQANISSVCCVTRILILDGSSIHSFSTFNSLSVMVAVMDTSNMDISIPFMLCVMYRYIFPDQHPSDCVHIPVSSLPNSLFYSVPALHLGRHSAPQSDGRSEHFS